MINGVREESSVKSRFVVCAMTGLLIFILGFFIHFGHEASASGSWRYVMPSWDDLTCWNIGQGRMMTPRCDGNPFYFEEQGTRHIVPYTTTEVLGIISKYTHIPLSWFFPMWYILAPFLTWLVIVVCGWKLWNYPLEATALTVLVLFLSTLFHSFVLFQWILIRFSRPMDGIALLFVWISLILKGNPERKFDQIAALVVPGIVLWLHPFYALLGLLITAMEYGFALFRREGFSKTKLQVWAMASILVFGLCFLGYAFLGKNINALIMQTPPPFDVRLFSHFVFAALWLAIVALVELFFVFSLKRKWTLLDRVMVECAVFGVLVCAGNVFLLKKSQLIHHLFYFLIPMIVLLTAWVYEKICALKESSHWSRLGLFPLLIVAIHLVVSKITGKNPFDGYATSRCYFSYMLIYCFWIFLALWSFERFDFMRRLLLQKKIIVAALFLAMIAGSLRIPLNAINKNFPFVGAYQWLKQHGNKDEVVLIASPKYRACDYLLWQTGMRSYYNTYGDIFAEGFGKDYRALFYAGLLLGSLNTISFFPTFEEKLSFLKLNYILIPIPSLFFDPIKNQLKEHLWVVYNDSRCVLFNVR